MLSSLQLKKTMIIFALEAPLRVEDKTCIAMIKFLLVGLEPLYTGLEILQGMVHPAVFSKVFNTTKFEYESGTWNVMLNILPLRSNSSQSQATGLTGANASSSIILTAGLAEVVSVIPVDHVGFAKFAATKGSKQTKEGKWGHPLWLKHVLQNYRDDPRDAKESISGARVRAPQERSIEFASKAVTRRRQSVRTKTLSRPIWSAAFIPLITEIASASSGSAAMKESKPAPMIKERLFIIEDKLVQRIISHDAYRGEADSSTICGLDPHVYGSVVAPLCKRPSMALFQMK
ncbi:hypothetical protein GIB67_006158 [Kingdonia uniflora]|uniref:Uncharacterized protein n=1 Tax=Kingdonia uniflora TaxID=39325 RepID=A0A7J7LPR8_9MAGN|nr:hypothetical protein GIB67_006158 [Kingdonia uniflora]